MRIGALIPIRLSSERLPGKALLKIKDRPVVHYLLDRVAACRYLRPADIVVCTTEDSADDPLAVAVKEYGASVFRGSRDDIVKRFRDTIDQFGFDAVVQVDGDDPLTEPQYMDLTMDKLLSDPALGIVWSEGLPLGVNCKSFTRKAMETVYRHYAAGQNDTGFIYYFTKTDFVRKAIVRPVSPDHVHETVRLTLDYDVDFEVFRRILEALDRPGHVARLAEVVAFLNKYPEIVAINSGLEETYWQRTREKAKLNYVDEAGARRTIEI